MTVSAITFDPASPADSNSPWNAARKAVVAGAAVVALGIGGFLLWSWQAPLSSAAVAAGHVTVHGYRKTIQHLEGGIVDEITVENGSRVAAGELLVRLDDTRARATFSLLSERHAAASAELWRLELEQRGAERFTLPNAMATGADSDTFQRVVAEQRGIFDARRSLLDGRIDVLEQQIGQSRREIDGLEAQIASHDEQLRLLDDELDGLQKLFDKGLVPKPRLRALQRRKAEIAGARGENTAMIARAAQRVGEARMEMQSLRNEHMESVAVALRAAQQTVIELEERLMAARDTLDRIELRAPVAGVVVGLRVHTRGGVVVPGEPLMEIVPEGDDLVVEARVDPVDIDRVHAGLAAQVRLTAFDRRNTPTVDGTVTTVSADRVQDTGVVRPSAGGPTGEGPSAEGYYIARIALDAESLAAAGNLRLYPGMPAEAMIVTGERTLMDYILAPIERTLERSLREG